MSRNYAQIATAIWRNDDFRALTSGAQHMYLLLTSQPDISAAGVLSLNVKRWSTRAKDTTRATVVAALQELQTSRFVFYDTDTEELLVRSFVRWDGGYTNPKRLPVIKRAAEDIESLTIRRALAIELVRLGFPEDWMGEFSTDEAKPVDDTFSQANSLFDIADSQSPSDGVVVSKGPYIETTTHNPLSPPHAAAAPKARSSQGTRLAEDWKPDDKLTAWAAEKYPRVDLDEATLAFTNHFLSATGRTASKRSWPRTWQNWIIEANRRLPRFPVNGSGYSSRTGGESNAPKPIPADEMCLEHRGQRRTNCPACRIDQAEMQRVG